MKKFILTAVILFVTLISCACDNGKSYILFNKYPFTKDTMTSTVNIFKPGERIYYLVTTPKKVETKRLLIQIYKMGEQERLGYEIVWGKQVKVRDEQVYYYTDYVVLNSTGAYQMNVYSKDNPTKILSTSQFYIRN